MFNTEPDALSIPLTHSLTLIHSFTNVKKTRVKVCGLLSVAQAPLVPVEDPLWD